MIVVTGASGNTGGIIVENLLSSRIQVRAIGRDIKRLEPFTKKGAEGFVADVTDAGALEKAFSGAQGVYVMIPPNPQAPDVRAFQERVSDAMVSAIRKCGVEYVVCLSSVGADKPDRVGPVLGLRSFEQKLNEVTGINALYLRPAYFMENLLPQTKIIQMFGMLAGPVRADLVLPMIATRDIGAVAADSLAKLNFSGKESKELLGARDVSYNEAAKIISAAIGKPDLRYMQLGPAQLKPALMQMGMSPNMADLLLEMADALNTGYMNPVEPRTRANTTATTLETFVAEEFVPAYRGKVVGA